MQNFLWFTSEGSQPHRYKYGISETQIVPIGHDHMVHTLSTTVNVPSSELGPSHLPLSRKRVCPPSRNQRGRDTLACGWGGWGGGPSSDDWIKSLELCLLCGHGRSALFTSIKTYACISALCVCKNVNKYMKYQKYGKVFGYNTLQLWFYGEIQRLKIHFEGLIFSLKYPEIS
jgi:hypothetical protein